jgi:hypothetical protein
MFAWDHHWLFMEGRDHNATSHWLASATSNVFFPFVRDKDSVGVLGINRPTIADMETVDGLPPTLIANFAGWE